MDVFNNITSSQSVVNLSLRELREKYRDDYKKKYLEKEKRDKKRAKKKMIKDELKKRESGLEQIRQSRATDLLMKYELEP